MSSGRGFDETITAAATTLADGLAAGADFLREMARVVDEVADGITVDSDDGDFDAPAAAIAGVLRERDARRPRLTVVDDAR